MKRDSGRSRRGRGRRPADRGGRDSRPRFEDDEPESAGRRGGGRGARKKQKTKFDWSAADDDDGEFEDDDDRDDDRDYDREPEPRRRRSSRGTKRKRRSLMDLCTPAFAYTAILPRQTGESQPNYQQFRDQVVEALRKVEADAPEQGIDPEDARQACYALCFFVDSQVAVSEWEGKSQWSMEPLGIVLQQDPEGGVNFFKRLESLGDRQKAVKEIFLVCLSLGFRGRLAELEPAQQAAQLTELKKEIVRGIRPEPLEKQPELFPEGYEPADPIQDEVPPPPRWWMLASIGGVLLALVVWVLLFIWAGNSPRTAEAEVKQQRQRVAEGPVVPAPSEPPAPESADDEEDGS